VIRRLRKITERKLDKEPSWRAKGRELTTGYEKVW
jgi:hydrogenase small subunit